MAESKLIVAYDPSLTAWGVAQCWARSTAAVTNRIETKCIQTQPASKQKHVYQSDKDIFRARKLFSMLKVDIEYAKSLGADVEIVSEAPAGSQSAKANKAFGIVLGLLAAISLAYNARLTLVTRNEAADIVAGTKDVNKQEAAMAAESYLEQQGFTTDYPFNDSKVRSEGRGDAMVVLAASHKAQLAQW